MSAPRRLRSRLRLRPVFSRRDFLKRAGSLVVLAGPLAGCGQSDAPSPSPSPAPLTPLTPVPAPPAPAPIPAPTPPAPTPPSPSPVPMAMETPFKHGVASGDPLPNAVMLWTRATPVATEEILVTLRVYRDALLTQLVDTRSQMATSARDWTIKIDFTGLDPATTYYYQFEAVGFKSVIGRSKTAPAAGAATARLRAGVVSCSSYAHGLFNAYKMLARRNDLDVILHLGDYIYEYGTGEYGNARPYVPATEMVSLADYRARHAHYKGTDADLREVHRHTAFITVWDDHETTDNSYTIGAVNHTEGAEGVWLTRKGFGQQAYDEWMPIRLPTPGDPNKIWRNLGYGDLLEFIMLDTRLFERDEPTGLGSPDANMVAADPTRTLLGDTQRSFLESRLTTAPVKWKVIGQQVMVSPFKLAPGLDAAGGGVYFNFDQWDGYQADRRRLLDFMRDGDLDNVVILTGDIHSSWAFDVTEDPNNLAVYTPGTAALPAGIPAVASTGSVCVEYVVPSVTSPGFEQIPGFANVDETVLLPNPHLKYFDGTRRGYCVLDVTPARFQCEWYYVPQIATPAETEAFGAAFGCDDGARRQTRGTQSMPIADAPVLAP